MPSLLSLFSMKHTVISVIIVLFAASTTQAQSLFDHWGVKAGFTLSRPIVINENIAYQVSSATGYQVEISKLLPITKGVGVQLSGGLVQMNSTLRGDRLLNLSEELSLSYGLLEAGLRGEHALGKFKPFGVVAMRGSRLFEDNLNDIFFFAFRESFDYGLSFSVGSEYALENLSPFVALNYYHGLLDIVSSSYYDGSGQLFENRIANRTWAVLVGIRF